MQIVRVYTGDDGESHFEDMAIPLEDHGAIGRLSALIPATGVIVRENDPDYDYDWHTAPRRQIVVLLSGGVEVEIGDGSKRQLYAGDLLFAEDTTGRGHRTRNLVAEPRTSLFITLD